MLDGIGTGDRVDGVGDAGFLRNDLLGPQGDEGGLFGRQGQRFVQRVCMQRLATPENGGEGLHRDANDIVFGLLGGERRPGGLRVEAQEQRARVFCVEAVAHDFGPQAARRAVLGNFFKKIIVGVEEKRELRREFVEDRKSTRLNSSHGYISYAVFCLKKKNKSSYDLTNLRHPKIRTPGHNILESTSALHIVHFYDSSSPAPSRLLIRC